VRRCSRPSLGVDAFVLEQGVHGLAVGADQGDCELPAVHAIDPGGQAAILEKGGVRLAPSLEVLRLGGPGTIVLHADEPGECAALVSVQGELQVRAHRQVAEVGFRAEVAGGAERGHGEAHQFARAVHPEDARAMEVIDLDQLAIDAMLGVLGRERPGHKPVPGPMLVGGVGAERISRIAVRGEGEEQGEQHRRHARISETGPRLSTNCSACTSIFWSIVSRTLLRRALSSRGGPQRVRHSSKSSA
jgi:hypothetical protein